MKIQALMIIALTLLGFTGEALAQKGKSPARTADPAAKTKRTVADSTAANPTAGKVKASSARSLQTARNSSGEALRLLRRSQDFVDDAGANYKRTLNYAERGAELIFCLNQGMSKPCNAGVTGSGSSTPATMRMVKSKLQSSLNALQNVTEDANGFRTEAIDQLRRAISQADSYIQNVPTGKPKGNVKNKNPTGRESGRKPAASGPTKKPINGLSEGDDPWGKGETKPKSKNQ